MKGRRHGEVITDRVTRVRGRYVKASLASRIVSDRVRARRVRGLLDFVSLVNIFT
jgi:hypothetical protein